MKGKRIFLLLMISMACATVEAYSYGHPDFKSDYKSPYKVELSIPLEELLAANKSMPRADAKLESEVPYEKWYSRKTLKEFGAWGPQSRHFPVIEGFDKLSNEWKRQRLVATACGLIGLPYQHHHIPDWDPPPNWPWKKVAYGRNSKGMDCSDFSSWVYNYGLGIKPNTGVGQQAEAEEVRVGEEGKIPIQKIRNENGYEGLVSKLVAGDLLYIKHAKDEKVSHVIMWVGKYGHSPDGTPLVIDCTGPEAKDCNGNQIPIGVQLRPFKRDGWYFKRFSHANRIIAE